MPLPIWRDIRHLRRKLENLDTSLRTSFSKIKDDISELQKHQADLEKSLDISSIKESLKEDIKREIMSEIDNFQRRENLTNTSTKKEAFGKRSVKFTERLVSVRQTPNTTIHLGFRNSRCY